MSDQPQLICSYCTKQTAVTRHGACFGCYEVIDRLDEFVRSGGGLARVLEAVSKRPPMPASAPLAEAIALGTSGQAGATGQLLAAELLVLQATLERVRAALREVDNLGDDEPFGELSAAAKIIYKVRAALGEP